MSVCKAYCCGGASQDVVDDKTKKHIQKLKTHGLERSLRPELAVPAERRSPVRINIYDLSTRNKSLKRVGFGIYHVGVVVFEIEWSFGESLEHTNGTGLFCCQPGTAGAITRTMFLGDTTLSPMQVDTILHRLENEWPSRGYHILHRNCNHFAQCFCNHLSTIEPLRIPAWCNRAARVADKVVPKKLATSVQRKVSGENGPPKATSSTAPAKPVAHLPRSIIPYRWYANPSIVQPPKYRINIGGTIAVFSSGAQGQAPGVSYGDEDPDSGCSPLGDGMWSSANAESAVPRFSPLTTPLDVTATSSCGSPCDPGSARARGGSTSVTSTFSAVEIEEIDPLRRIRRPPHAGQPMSPSLSSSSTTNATPLLRAVSFGREPPAAEPKVDLGSGAIVGSKTRAMPGDLRDLDKGDDVQRDTDPPPLEHASGMGSLETGTFSPILETPCAWNEEENENMTWLQGTEQQGVGENGQAASLKYLDPNAHPVLVDHKQPVNCNTTRPLKTTKSRK